MAITLNGTTGIVTADGSVGAPGLKGTDGDSGVSFAADSIKFSTGGVERLAISNTGVAGTGVGGLFSSYALIIDSKSSGTNGGVASTSTWNVRTLNTEVADPDSIVSISSNKFTLAAGSYVIKWSCPGHQINRNQSRLYDVTNTAAIAYGQAMRSYASDVTTSLSTGVARVTPSGSTEYRIEHNCETSSSGDNEFGQGNSLGGTMTYTIVEIYKEA